MTAPYTHLIEWRGVLVTVDCDAEPDDDGLTMLPVRVLVGERDITALVDMEALWLEVDRLRFELAGANERTRIAREERERAEGLYWQLQMRAVKGGPT